MSINCDTRPLLTNWQNLQRLTLSISFPQLFFSKTLRIKPKMRMYYTSRITFTRNTSMCVELRVREKRRQCCRQSVIYILVHRWCVKQLPSIIIAVLNLITLLKVVTDQDFLQWYTIICLFWQRGSDSICQTLTVLTHNTLMIKILMGVFET